MSTETNKAICRRMLEQLWNEQRVDLVQEFLAEDIVQHIAGAPPSPPGLENYIEVLNIHVFCHKKENIHPTRKSMSNPLLLAPMGQRLHLGQVTVQ